MTTDRENLLHELQKLVDHHETQAEQHSDRAHTYREMLRAIERYYPEDPETRHRREEGLAGSIDNLELSARSSNVLRNEGVQTIGQFLAWMERGRDACLRTPNFGRISWHECAAIYTHLTGKPAPIKETTK